jgi:hypothetical protein
MSCFKRHPGDLLYPQRRRRPRQRPRLRPRLRLKLLPDRLNLIQIRIPITINNIGHPQGQSLYRED